MYALMFYKIAPMNECLITHITNIRALTTMCALKCYQGTLYSECLLTNFAAIRMVTNMYALLF